MTTSANSNGGKYPESFIPNRPSTLTAPFVRFSIGVTRDSTEVPIAVLEIDGVDRGLWLHTSVLRSQFRKLDPKEGENVTVEFAGEKTKSANGFKYWNDVVYSPDRPVEEVTIDHPVFGGDHDQAGDDQASLPLGGEEVDDHGTPIRY